MARVISWCIVLALAIPAFRWVMASPMLEFSVKGSHVVFFPPAGPKDRFQYFHDLTIARGEHVRYATCVLCSVTVEGQVDQQVTALWGDVTVESDGIAGQGIEVVGGSFMVLAGGRVNPPPLSALGGTANIDPTVQTYRSFVISQPGFYYPGQRSFPARGVSLFIAALLLMLTCGGWLPSAAFRERVATSVRQPIWSAILGAVLIALLPILLSIAIFSLYIFPPLYALLFCGGLTVYWVLLTIGFASLAPQVGSLAGASPLAKHVSGAIVIIVAMLIPVLGFFAMAAVMLVALGAGARASLPNLKRRLSNPAHSPG